jgi:hypothetical protein
MTRLKIFAALILILFWSRGMAIEEPDYRVEKTTDVYEIRAYEPYIVAQTLVTGDASDAGNEGFRILAAYIFGKNQSQGSIAMTAPVAQSAAKIEMTAPVAMRAGPKGYWVQFAMPHQWTLATLPKPLDERVQLIQMPARRVAVVRYSGFWSESRYEENLARLRAALVADGLVTEGDPVWARYDPPWIPWFLRRNEIWLQLEPG